jgi:hypothetical protein
MGSDVRDSITSGQLQGKLVQARDHAQGLAPHVHGFFLARMALLREAMTEFVSGYKESRDGKLSASDGPGLFDTARGWLAHGPAALRDRALANLDRFGHRLQQSSERHAHSEDAAAPATTGTEEPLPVPPALAALGATAARSAVAAAGRLQAEVDELRSSEAPLERLKDLATAGALQASDHMRRTLADNVATIKDLMTPEEAASAPPPPNAEPPHRLTAQELADGYLRTRGYNPDMTDLEGPEAEGRVVQLLRRGAAAAASNLRQNIATLADLSQQGVVRAEAHLRSYPAPKPGEDMASGPQTGTGSETAPTEAGGTKPPPQDRS